ncbi:D-cysteine desulfhydrase family protein [Microbulbifer hydrolyticus]|uniref:D-cysteine desulfhydrase n=1 Tax=Microbulbifer hydrolyticus TaxID=48074 RepID=A0A6P1TAY7_9GAMM|nr:D-cysteine desulfhydrase family protein [Microbulbifer hydrolyticus]MBB5210340.1 D-cysteine desulfhydrase [Microbulbifer hydrolyticus]QHQ39167.1 pyridoxal-phosphate dependent enzyme [Microbulbifer hydrolyticus]
MSIQYPARERLANLPTPLQPLDRISEQFSLPHGGPKIWIKRDDLTESAMSGNKLRKLEFIIAEARARGCNTLITCGGEQSNHCRATALAAAKTGMKAHLILRGGSGTGAPETPDGNLLVDYLAGAQVSLYPMREYVDTLPQLFEQWARFYEQQGDRALCIPTGGSDGLGIWGYLLAAEELLEDCRREGFAPDRLICASGSGGTQAGLTLGCQVFGSSADVTAYAVCDSTDYFIDKVRQDVADWAHRYRQAFPFDESRIHVIDDYIGPGYAIATEEIYQTIALAAQLEGILLDPVYTGKAFHGMLQDIKQGKYSGCKNLVFVHTGGQFGVFPQRTGFQNSWSQQ